jgi:TetR/AcrR family transcriptional regulator, mexJK operon transcriptional repressor
MKQAAKHARAAGAFDARTPAPIRTQRKKQAIVDAATLLFLQQGYQGTSMDQIAAAAAVSKQTVYTQFNDKERLFSSIVLGITERAEAIAATIDDLFEEIAELDDGLTRLARVYSAAVVHPQVLQLRRLIISEADRFPDLAQTYFERAPGRGLEAIAAGLGRLAERTRLRIDDPATAAVHFAYLVLGPIIDKALFHPNSKIGDAEIAHYSDAGVDAFLAAYT